jgi:hypothetical protein
MSNFERMNGGDGFVGENYLMVWPVEELIKSNKDYRVAEAAPGLFVFGSSGGGEAFAFDTRVTPPGIVTVPFIVMRLRLRRISTRSCSTCIDLRSSFNFRNRG